MTCLHTSACRKSMSSDCKKYQFCHACANRARAASPEQRAKLADMAKSYWSDPDRRAQESARKKALWADPVWRANYMKSYLAKRGFKEGLAIKRLPAPVRSYAIKLKCCGIKGEALRSAIE